MRYFQKKSEKYLRKKKIPYDQIICVGPFFRRAKKLKVLKEEGADVLIDDDTALRHYLRRRAFVSLPPEKFIQLSQAVF
ncbi:MAG: hypothetical protein GF370_00175 [Candidatus Nealsonbacteria bacterium]|nr:hypothetical protein [Candidatus Nealsonbacteria bacterium]